jgi:hypothetical protein
MYIASAYLLHIEGGTLEETRLDLINVPSVKGYEGRRNFGEYPSPKLGE